MTPRKPQAARVPVSERALVQRINRTLAKEGRSGEVLRKTRPGRWATELGEYYVVDLDANSLLQTGTNVEELGRELGVLKPYEQLVSPR